MMKVQNRPFRGLDDNFMQALIKGELKHILTFEGEHRKSFMVELRKDFLDLYFLGHTVEVKGTEKTGYYLSASSAFNPENLLTDKRIRVITNRKSNKWQIFFNDIKSYEQFEEIMNAVIVKIVIHKKGDISEGVSEINHFIDNRTITKNGVIIIDRQVVYPGLKECRIDLLGLKKLANGKFTFVVIELKNKTNKDIVNVFSQIEKYIKLVIENYEHFKATYQEVIYQKFKLRLLKRFKFEILSLFEGKESIEGIVVLDNYNIKSKLLGLAMDSWNKNVYMPKIKLFLKSNIFDDAFFMDYIETLAFLRGRK